MTILEMLGQSGVLTLLGMGIVFSFLIILIIVISQLGRLMSAKDLDNGPPVYAAQTRVSAATSGTNAEITAAISAAVNEYKKSN